MYFRENEWECHRYGAAVRTVHSPPKIPAYLLPQHRFPTPMLPDPIPADLMPSDPMTARYENALRFLYDRINYEKLVTGAARYPFRLRRMSELLTRLGLSHFLDPSHLPPSHCDSDAVPGAARGRVPLVHIAGTKGKGSVATMVSAALSAAGIKTGTYTSPHLHRLEERFRVNGDPCSPSQLIEAVDQVRRVADIMAGETIGSPTFFELTTALSLLHFDRSDCQAVVMEVGLGGRLDSTNVCRPAVSVITSIGLDHQYILGDTKELIAAEKAGIIKPGVPTVCGTSERAPLNAIEKIADSQSSPLHVLDRDFRVHHRPDTDWGSEIDFIASGPPFHSMDRVALSLEGAHQARNAAVAIATLQQLQQQECFQQSVDEGAIDEGSIRTAFADLDCQGRMERYWLPGNVTVLVDAAHNEDSIAALCDSASQRFRCRSGENPDDRMPITFVFGTSIDKDAETMIRQISALADTLVLTRFTGNPRFTDPEKLRSHVPSSWTGPRVIDPDPISACGWAVDHAPVGSAIIVCGSFFLAAETQRWFADRQSPVRR